ncbi:lysosomal alpha-glucosidase [Paragonimus westermani]|uniref:Lysosomal alpha-glucosidase n=1 Tax=Paragonimus westermani TaxID=34504 RepID=A0A5J4NLU2_9TREM|nr:lysosomal alpha-glucosidase [Paragonimus westermani]
MLCREMVCISEMKAIVFTLASVLSLTVSVEGQAQCMPIPVSARLDCHPEEGANEEKCIAKGCCWTPRDANDPGIPMCYFPTNYPKYFVTSVTPTSRGFLADLSKIRTGFGMNESKHARVEIRHETKNRLRIRFTIPSDSNRWEPPIPLGEPENPPPAQPEYVVQLMKSPFGLQVARNNEAHDILLDSSGFMSASTIIADQFLQVSFRLFAQRGFGPGELRTSFPQPLSQWSRDGLWARDTAPMAHENLYGVHNFFMGLSYDGTAFGIFLLNSNAQEVALTPLPAITYRTVGGILDFFIFTGPKPKDVIAQYYDLIGHPPLPPYWSLGFHLCRYGYRNLEEVAQTVKRNMDAGIPIEAQWVDIDYMDQHKIWSVDPVNFADLGNFIRDTLHKRYGIKSVLIVDPAVSTQGGPDYATFSTGLKSGIFINDSRTGKPILGTVWPGETVFPDFSHPNAEQWWYELVSRFHENVPFDGLWIDMNEPANFDAGSTTGCDNWDSLNNPPFVPEILDRSLYAKTICPSALHYNTTHYNRHNLYGYDHARVTRHALERLFPGKRSFLLSRSTFAGSGRYTIHWTGDNLSSWADMRASILQLFNFNMFAMPIVGADICGFRDDTTEELCIRWSQLGAFYPFARNHNGLGSIPQDPAVWSKKGTEAIRDALQLRYTLLPYFYSLFFRAHLHGETIIRALAFEFPDELATHTINKQFMLGSCVLVTPVLEESRTWVEGYVPAGEWINLSTGLRLTSHGEVKYFKAPLNVIPVLIRGGCILPTQNSWEITSISRKKGLSLFVVLSSVDDGSPVAGRIAKAAGELFWDDGESDPLNYVHVRFTVNSRVLIIHPDPSHLAAVASLEPQETDLKSIIICGISTAPRSIRLNEQLVKFEYDEKLSTVVIHLPDSTKFTEQARVTWSFD